MNIQEKIRFVLEVFKSIDIKIVSKKTVYLNESENVRKIQFLLNSRFGSKKHVICDFNQLDSFCAEQSEDGTLNIQIGRIDSLEESKGKMILVRNTITDFFKKLKSKQRQDYKKREIQNKKQEYKLFYDEVIKKIKTSEDIFLGVERLLADSCYGCIIGIQHDGVDEFAIINDTTGRVINFKILDSDEPNREMIQGPDGYSLVFNALRNKPETKVVELILSTFNAA